MCEEAKEEIIKELNSYICGLDEKRKNGDVVIGYHSIKKMLKEIIEKCQKD